MDRRPMDRKARYPIMSVLLEKFVLTPELDKIVSNSPSVIIPDTKETLYELIFGN